MVCSLPPIINSEHSKCTINTKNVFIDLTACDYTKANIVLNQVCAAFSAHCEEEFTIEPVEVVYEEDYPVRTSCHQKCVRFLYQIFFLLSVPNSSADRTKPEVVPSLSPASGIHKSFPTPVQQVRAVQAEGVVPEDGAHEDAGGRGSHEEAARPRELVH